MQEKPTELIETEEKPSIFWQDEILQVMYWMRGEGFGEQITVAQLQKFLDASDETFAVNLSALEKKNLVDFNFSDTYELTETGVIEGGRRFADEFEGMTKQGHYECDDPNCDCQSGEPCLAIGHSHQH
jgi:hypothetical protein